MKKLIVIAGGSGLIGRRLQTILSENGYSIKILTRNKSLLSDSMYVHWDPSKNEVDAEKLKQCSVIVNLAGASVVGQKWTKGYKEKIISSRVDSNACLKQLIQQLDNKPLLVSASAIGYYGYRNTEVGFHEEDKSDDGDFLQEVCEIWEKASDDVGSLAHRHVTIRIGIVLAKEGGALKEMQKGFLLRTGSYFGPGDQVYSWIHLDDLSRMILHVIETESARGVFNGVAPQPVTSKILAQSIANAKWKSGFLLMPIPRFMAKLILGEQERMLTGSCKVSANKIEESGFSFKFPQVDQATQDLI